MRGIVAFDSVYGNTMRVAEAIADELRGQGHEIELIDLGRKVPRGMEADFAFIGSPTRNGKMTSRAKSFVKRLDADHWSARPIVAFDTVMHLPEDPRQRDRMVRWTENGAAPRIKALVEERGMQAYPEVLRVEVTGLKGPLLPGSLDRSREFARKFAAELK
ncbi:MAG: hypothetical protein ISF22_06435 [Methanomassiliicoccus sp.]|nr:hypothetical protein [Methanomassiliicoccus sp.]